MHFDYEQKRIVQIIGEVTARTSRNPYHYSEYKYNMRLVNVAITDMSNTHKPSGHTYVTYTGRPKHAQKPARRTRLYAYDRQLDAT